jgi:hypothetical protein
MMSGAGSKAKATVLAIAINTAARANRFCIF